MADSEQQQLEQLAADRGWSRDPKASGAWFDVAGLSIEVTWTSGGQIEYAYRYDTHQEIRAEDPHKLATVTSWLKEA
jgi:hypothetical protein